MASQSHAGSIVQVTAPEEYDNVWEVRQVDLAPTLPLGAEGSGRDVIDWSFGPLKMVGYVDTNTFEIALSETVAGVNLGNTFGNLKDGLVTKIDLFCVKGETKKYLKNGNEVWIHLNLKVVFNGSYNGDYKILTI